MSVEKNLKIIEIVDEAFNERNWDVFNRCHTESIICYTPRNPESDNGIDAHRESVKGLISTFPDFHLKRERSFGQGDWTCAIYKMTGTHKGPLQGTGGKTIPPTNKPIRIDLAITLRFEGGKIAEEHIYYDRLAMLTQLGVCP